MNSCMFVVPSLSDGGAERVVSILSSELTTMIERVYVLIYWNTKFDYEVNKNVDVINLSEGDKQAYDQMKVPERLKRMRSIISEKNPEFVVPFLPHVCLQVGIATLGLKCTVIQTVRNNPMTSPSEKNRRWIRDQQIKFSKCTIVQNKEQKEYFPKSWWRKIQILPNPVNEEFFNQRFMPPQDKFKVVAVGRLDEQKNFPMLIRAFGIFAENHKSVELNIYGDGKLRESLEKQINEAGLNGIVSLCGRSNKIPEILSTSSLFVMSSDFEGMPNSLMEAMAVGIPVVSTDCPTGSKELIGNNERGMLVPAADEIALSQALEDVYHNYGIWRDRGCKATEHIESKYRQREIAKQFIAICTEDKKRIKLNEKN